MRLKSFYFLLILFAVSFLAGAQEIDQRDLTEVTKALNSRFDEQNIVLSVDGQTLYFTRANDSSNVGGTKDKGDIWFSKLAADGKWQKPQNLGKPINDAFRNAVIGFSPDGNIMFLNNEKGTPGSLITNEGMLFSVNQGGEWSEPKKANIDYFLNKSKHQSGSISTDGKIMVLSLLSYGSRGEEDIYVSFYENGKWSQPKNLGSDINTPQQEMTPFLARDNKTLYFSSNGYGGKGGRDIFVSQRMDDTWRSWSKPKNIGGEVNSQGVELGYFIDYNNEVAYYSSTKDSDGYGDVKVTKVELEQEIPEDTVVAVVYDDMTNAIEEPPVIEEEVMEEVTEEVVPESISFSGRVISEKDGKPVAAAIKLLGDGGELMVNTNEADGTFMIKLPLDTKEVAANIKAPGYMGIEEQFEVGNEKELSKEFKMTPLEVGATIRLNKVYFERGTASLIDSSYPELNRLVDMLTENPEVQIELAGHTDNQGDAKLNIKLSQERVDIVQEYLVSRGIDKKRVKGKGYGGSRPVASNASEETRKLNRRVEIMIVKN